MKYERMRRVDELIQRELGLLCEREIAPYLSGLITITKVKTSSDLRHAQVYFSVMGGEDVHEQALKLMLDRRTHLQHEIATRIKLKYTPVLKFHVDQSPEQADHVLAILSELGLDDVPDEATLDGEDGGWADDEEREDF